MTSIEALLLAGSRKSDNWASYERSALRALLPFLQDEFDRLDVRVCTYRMDGEQSPAVERERYFVWLCESIVFTIGAIRRGDLGDIHRGQLQIAQCRGRVDAYQSCLGTARDCWLDAGLCDTISAINAHGARERYVTPSGVAEGAADVLRALDGAT